MFILLDVVIAALLAGIIGLERELMEKPAGLRTQMIVGGATALMVSLGQIIVMRFVELGLAGYIRSDPVRILQAVIVGVSFIGAGTVLQMESTMKIKFLTTAATILFSAGIGATVALKQYLLAIGITLFVLIINLLMRLVEKKIGVGRKK